MQSFSPREGENDGRLFLFLVKCTGSPGLNGILERKVVSLVSLTFYPQPSREMGEKREPKGDLRVRVTRGEQWCRKQREESRWLCEMRNESICSLLEQNQIVRERGRKQTVREMGNSNFGLTVFIQSLMGDHQGESP